MQKEPKKLFCATWTNLRRSFGRPPHHRIPYGEQASDDSLRQVKAPSSAHKRADEQSPNTDVRYEQQPRKASAFSLHLHGLRLGEAMGLMWEDIDFEQGLIHVRRNVTHPRNAPVIGTPKTKNGMRAIPFGEHFAQILKPMRSTGFLFGGLKPISRKAYQIILKHIGKQVELYGATPHVLRHTYLTTLAGMNTDVKTLQSIAGHADIQTTMNVYVHPRMENIHSAGQQMDALLNQYAAS